MKEVLQIVLRRALASKFGIMVKNSTVLLLLLLLRLLLAVGYLF